LKIARVFSSLWCLSEDKKSYVENKRRTGETIGQNFKAIPVVRVESVDFLVAAGVLSLVKVHAIRQARFGVMFVSSFARAEKM
jgi:hypothetical protein